MVQVSHLSDSHDDDDEDDGDGDGDDDISTGSLLVCDLSQNKMSLCLFPAADEFKPRKRDRKSGDC